MSVVKIVRSRLPVDDADDSLPVMVGVSANAISPFFPRAQTEAARHVPKPAIIGSRQKTAGRRARNGRVQRSQGRRYGADSALKFYGRSGCFAIVRRDAGCLWARAHENHNFKVSRYVMNTCGGTSATGAVVIWTGAREWTARTAGSCAR